MSFLLGGEKNGDPPRQKKWLLTLHSVLVLMDSFKPVDFDGEEMFVTSHLNFL